MQFAKKIHSISHKWNSKPVTIGLVLLVFSLAVRLSPLNTQTLFSAAQELTFLPTMHFAQLKYSHLHDRPFERCPDVHRKQTEQLEKVRNRLPLIEEERTFELIKVYRLLQLYNQEALHFYSSPCTEAWQHHHYFINYQHSYAYSVPQLWLIDNFQLTEIYMALFLIVGSWFGLVALFLITQRLAQSNLVGLLAIALFLSYLLPFFPTLSTASNQRLYLLNTFPLIFLGQLFVDSSWGIGKKDGSPQRLLSYFQEASALALFGVFALISYSCFPLTSRIEPLVIAAAVLLAGLLRREKKILLRVLLVGITLFIFLIPYQRYASSLLQPISAVATEGNAEFRYVNMFTYLFERPNSYGIPHGDFAYTWVLDHDYYLRRSSLPLNFHHSFPYWGRTFLLDLVRNHPGELLETWWKRIFTQIYFHQDLSFGAYGSNATFGTTIFWLSLFVIFFATLAGAISHPVVWPPAAILFWHTFGLHTLVALIHTHHTYFLKGLFLVWCIVPGFVGLFFKQIIALSRPFRSQDRPRIFSSKMGLAVGTILILMVLFALPYFIREGRKEIHAFHIWAGIHIGIGQPEFHLKPDEIVQEVEKIRELGYHDPGTVDMYAAWILFAYVERKDYYRSNLGEAKAIKHEERAKSLMLPLYHKALEEAPDNPYFPVYARYMGDPGWEALYAKTLEQFPDHPYAAMMSWALANESQLSDEKKRHYARHYETSVGTLLQHSSKFRPGYQRLPQLAFSPNGVTPEEVPQGLRIELPANSSATFPTVDMLHSDRTKIGLFLKVVEGIVFSEFIEEKLGLLGNVVPMTPADFHNYRILFALNFVDLGKTTLQLRTGGNRAIFIVRDFYPMHENPRFFRTPTTIQGRTPDKQPRQQQPPPTQQQPIMSRRSGQEAPSASGAPPTSQPLRGGITGGAPMQGNPTVQLGSNGMTRRVLRPDGTVTTQYREGGKWINQTRTNQGTGRMLTWQNGAWVETTAAQSPVKQP